MQNALQGLDPAQLIRIADMQLLARSVVRGFMTGLHRSPFFGSSVEFAQYRPYAQSDDPRFIDWPLYARTDRLHVKQFQDETNLRCLLLLDCSASMNYASGEVPKFTYARMLTACLATILAQQKDAVGLLGFHEDRYVYIPPRNTPSHFRRLMVELANLKAERQTDLNKALHDLGDLLKPRGLVVLISDLLHPAEGIAERLKLVRARKQDVLVMQISDIAEQTFPFDRTVTLVDLEDSREQYVTPDAVRKQYLENRDNHFSAIRQTCLTADIDYGEFVTNEPLDRALHLFIQHRNRMLRAAGTKRNRPSDGGW